MKVLVVGDIMTDRYTYVKTNRNSQEVDVPVWDFSKMEYRQGGAANVAVNLKALGGDTGLVRLAGLNRSDSQAKVADYIDYRLCSAGCDGSPQRWGSHGAQEHDHNDMIKHRFVDDVTGEIIFRFDNKKKFEKCWIENFERKFLGEDLDEYDVIVVSEYDKGTVTEKRAKKIVSEGRQVIVDSKRLDLRIFEGARILKVNEEEYSTQVSCQLYTNVERLFECVVVTKGKMGTELRMNEKYDGHYASSYTVHMEQFTVERVTALDVTGCGDTHTAAMAVALLRDDKDVRNAVRYANRCASLAVQRFGTTRVSKWDYTKNFV